VGTGFLADTSFLGDRFPQRLFVNNSHVISATARAALPPEQACVTFSALGDDDALHAVRGVVFESPPDELDCAFVELADLPSHAAGLGLGLTARPPVWSAERRHGPT
jgi:hypothetical protein